MKRISFLIIPLFCMSLLVSTGVSGQNDQKPTYNNPSSVQSIDSLISTLYNVISMPPGKRNWNEFKNLFLPNARLISIKMDNAGKYNFYNVTVDDYIEMIKPKLDNANYFEIEIGRKQEEYNNIAQVFSTYKSTLILEKDILFESGINSFQLIYYKDRWWIVSALFNNETRDNMIPDKYKFN